MWFIFTYKNPNQQNDIQFSTYAIYADNFQVALKRFRQRIIAIFHVELQDHEYKYTILDYSDQECGSVIWCAHMMSNGDFSTRNEPTDFDE